ncbi:MAG TPA: hypothetical protein VJ754_04760, partial [Anaerolineae bacterium]|nr:hypothetical protein [Anaerolineae bacterium]
IRARTLSRDSSCECSCECTATIRILARFGGMPEVENVTLLSPLPEGRAKSGGQRLDLAIQPKQNAELYLYGS